MKGKERKQDRSRPVGARSRHHRLARGSSVLLTSLFLAVLSFRLGQFELFDFSGNVHKKRDDLEPPDP